MQPHYRYTTLEISPEQLAHDREIHGGLAAAVRDLGEACLQTTVDEVEIREITDLIRDLTTRLRKEQIEGSFGVALTPELAVVNDGNAVVGVRNPVAPPVKIHRGGDGHTWTSFTLSALYEGPPGLVHGGVISMILDQMLGECAADGGGPGMTGTLSIRYQRPTPLGDCSAEAWVTELGEHKTLVRGVMRDAEGNDTAEATGIFVLPKRVRERAGSPMQPSAWG